MKSKNKINNKTTSKEFTKLIKWPMFSSNWGIYKTIYAIDECFHYIYILKVHIWRYEHVCLCLLSMRWWYGVLVAGGGIEWNGKGMLPSNSYMLCIHMLCISNSPLYRDIIKKKLLVS